MPERMSDVLKRLGWEIPEPKPPLPPDPGCEPWCRENNGRLRLESPGCIRSLDDPQPSMLDLLKAIQYAYCPCPRGDAARIATADALAAHERDHHARVLARGIAASQLPPALCRYTLDEETERPRVVERLRAYQQASWIAGVNLLLTGDVGVRKTTWATAILRDDLAIGRSGLFVVVARFLAKLRASYGNGSTTDEQQASEYQQVQDAITRDLLVLDDLPMLTDWGRGIVFLILNERESWQRPTILTSNLSVEDLEISLGKRAYDRFRAGAVDPETGVSYALDIHGQSQRGRRP